MDVEVLYDKVASFTSVADLVGYLESEQVRGIPEAISLCPLAMYLKRGERVFDVEVAESVRINWGEPEGQEFPLTQTMSTFIQDFDHGHYPSVVMESEYSIVMESER